MERDHHRPQAQRLACVACSSPVQDERCGYCGAVQEAGGYRVLQVLSRSGHGAVYLAEDSSGARVALKELVFSLVPSTQELDAFDREAGLLRTLSHPALPKFRDAFKIGQGVATRLYLVQEYVPGSSLAGHLSLTRYDEAQVLVYARQVLEVLAYLHSRSPPVVHRDIKPANLVVTTDGFLKLVDLGAAREVAPQGTHRSTLVGTFGYMAPEQLGGSVEPRSDLYALGATLVHLLTRRPPDQLMTPGHELDFERQANITPRTRDFLKLLTAVRPEHRFASAHRALAYLDGDVPATPVTRHSLRQLGLVVSGALAIAAGVGAYAAVKAAARSAEVTSAAVTPQRPPLRTEPPVRPTEAQPPGHIAFPWHRGSWDFHRSQGPFLHDESGRGHDIEIPRTGYTNDFFGLDWDGSTFMSLADHPDFAVKGGPLMLQFNAVNWRGAPATLMERVSADGEVAWRLSIDSERIIAFTVGDGRGSFSTIEGRVPRSHAGGNLDGFHLYAIVDDRTGEQLLYADCDLLASGTTKLAIPKTLGDGARVNLLEGFHGVVGSFSIENGRMEPTAPTAKSCSMSGRDLGVSRD